MCGPPFGKTSNLGTFNVDILCNVAECIYLCSVSLNVFFVKWGLIPEHR